jgi:hypothetical protein
VLRVAWLAAIHEVARIANTEALIISVIAAEPVTAKGTLGAAEVVAAMPTLSRYARIDIWNKS